MRIIVDDIQTPLMKALSEKYPGIATKLADAWERVPNISPKTLREFCFPYMDRLRENCKGFNIGISWFMTYGEGVMPDAREFLIEKLPYAGGLTNTNTEGVPASVYRDLAVDMDLPLGVHIPALVIMDGPVDRIIEFTRKMVKESRPGVKDFSWMGLVPATAPLEHIRALLAAGQAFSINPCPAVDGFDKIKVEVPRETRSFEEFVREKAKENPDGFSFHWLKDTDFKKFA
jgi:hypothetical protein